MAEWPADSDPWLRRWLPLIAERAADQPILELGCGGGRDTATLADAGQTVVGIDLSAESIARATSRVPSARFHCQDLRQAFPPPAGLGVVLASLSLHYFDWTETTGIVERIRQHLRPGGVLLCRLNSTRDVHHGARPEPPEGDNFYLVDGVPKRFFDRRSVDRLFATGWRRLSAEELVVERYARSKALWELVLARSD